MLEAVTTKTAAKSAMPHVKVDPATLKGKEKIEWMRNHHNEMVRGMFKFYEVPGGLMSFDFLEFKGDPVRHFDLKDGEVYTLPRGVAKHLNKNCWYPTYNFEVDKDGKQIQRATNKVRRCGFHSLEFTDDVDLTDNRTNIVGIQTI